MLCLFLSASKVLVKMGAFYSEIIVSKVMSSNTFCDPFFFNSSTIFGIFL